MAKEQNPVKRKKTDWEAVERDYRTGKYTLRELEARHGANNGLIARKSKKEGWTKAQNERFFFENSSKNNDFSKTGFVYVIAITDTAGKTFHKIGMASHIETRIKTHQCSCPFPISLVIGYYVGNMAREEIALQEMFSHRLLRGEWFCLTDSDIDLISRRAVLL